MTLKTTLLATTCAALALGSAASAQEAPASAADDNPLLASIEVLGARVGRVAQARARVEEIRRTFARVRAAVEGRTPVRAVVVLQRDPLFVVGRGSFIDEMLRSRDSER